VLLSAWYVVLQRVLQLVVLRLRSREFKELEIVVLRHEMAILGVGALILRPLESRNADSRSG
jgi:hypothetical protein